MMLVVVIVAKEKEDKEKKDEEKETVKRTERERQVIPSRFLIYRNCVCIEFPSSLYRF